MTVPRNFENFFNQAHVPFAILTGKDFVFAFANPAYIQLMNGRQLIGKTLREAIPELEGQPFEKMIKQVYETGVSLQLTETAATAVFKDNQAPTTRLFNMIYTPYHNEKGVIEGVHAMGYDVTEQVETRKENEQNTLNQQAFNLFMQAPVGICILNGPNYIIELANKPVLEIWGKDLSVIGKPVLQALPEIEGQSYLQLLDKVKTTGEAIYANENAAKLIRNNKEEDVFLNFVYQPYFDEDGYITGVLAIATEVTEQVVARQKIEFAEERARLAIESAELGTFEVNLKTDEIISSRRLIELFGYDQFVSRSELATAFHPDDITSREKANRIALITGNLEYEGRVTWKDKTIHWLKIKGKIYYSADGKPERLIGVAQDITEQKLFAEELSKQVEQQTKELLIKNKELQQINGELEQFAYAASHDMQEPLRKVQTFSSMLLNHCADTLDEKGKTFLNKIGSSVKRMKTIIDDLLSYSQNSGEHHPLVLTDLNKIISNIEDDLELMVQQKNATIIKENLPVINAIPSQINQLFYNLIFNSLKFEKAGITPEIRISSKKLSPEEVRERENLNPDKNYIHISITDNGIGFDQNYALQIFSLFKKLHGRSEYEGTGIGLALCKKIVENHKGEIYAVSQPNKGATFNIILPTGEISG